MGGEPYRLVAAGVTLRDQFNQRWPDRDKASDGWIADANHGGESFHQPDNQGWVRAIDIDENLDPADPGALKRAMDQLAALCREGGDHGRILHIVYEDQVASGTPGKGSPDYWRFRSSGYGHTQHAHISFTDKARRDARPFPLPIFAPKPPPEPEPTPATEVPTMIVLRNGLSKYRLVTGDRIVGISEEFAKALVAAGVPQPAVPTADLDVLTRTLVAEA